MTVADVITAIPKKACSGIATKSRPRRPMGGSCRGLGSMPTIGQKKIRPTSRKWTFIAMCAQCDSSATSKSPEKYRT